jgi:riboflavin synthase
MTMFTGIVEEVGEVVALARGSDSARLTLRGPTVTADAVRGVSIAVNGVCLTVVDTADGSFTVDVMRETLDRSTLADLGVGGAVNLERAVRPSGRLGGHIVQGHVDGVGTVLRVTTREDARLLDLEVPSEVARVSVPLGSITVDGVSLTVNAMPAPGTIQISLIPFTLEHTTLADRRPGDRVHLEADTIGKYVAALLERERRG